LPGPSLVAGLGGAELQDLAEHQHGPLPRRQDLHRRHQRQPHIGPHSDVETRVGKRLQPGDIERRREPHPGIVARRAQPGRQRPPRTPSSAERHALVAIRYNQVHTDTRVRSYRSRAFYARSIVSCTRSSALWNEPSIR
jgi:hypothetical protein